MEDYTEDSRISAGMSPGMSEKQQTPVLRTYRTEASSEVSMGEIIQREQEYKRALGEQKTKKFIPARTYLL